MRTLPPVELVRPGLWSIPTPIPDNPLGYTLVYLIESDRGPVLVDNGWNDHQTLQALSSGMRHAGFELADTYGLLVTHQHPDHHGLSGVIRDISGAWVAMHAADAEVVTHRRDTEEAWLYQTAAVLLAHGASEDAVQTLPSVHELKPPPEPALPNRLLADDELADVPGWDVRVVWTPGHTAGHVCFVVERYDVLLSGDHVLPKITPHIGLYRDEDESDPLGDYLRSLERLTTLWVQEVLPAHEHRFPDLVGRAKALIEHHEERLAAVEAALRDGPATAWEVTERMGWRLPWGDIDPTMKRAALGEARAHVRYLERVHKVREVAGSRPVVYELVRD